jgi:plastocyanin
MASAGCASTFHHAAAPVAGFALRCHRPRSPWWLVLLAIATAAGASARVALPDDVAAGADPAPGGLVGTVTVGSAISSRSMRYRIYPESNPLQPLPPVAFEGEQEEVENVVVYLESAPEAPTPARPSRPYVIEQVQERFVPHVLPVLQGSVVEFPNNDPIFHNVFSLSSARTFDLGRYPQTSSKSVRFDRPGVVKVFCHIHSDMSAVVFVLDNPYFTKPAADGSFRIDDVPPGEYTVVAWHERAQPTSRQVVIAAGQATVVDFSIPLDPEGERQ